MITLNDIIINQNTHKDVLFAAYSGYNFPADSRKLSIFRSGIKKWDELKNTQKQKLINDLITLCSVFNEYHLARFLLSNMEEFKEFIITLFALIGKAHPEYYNVCGINIESIHYYNEDIETELRELY